MVLHIRMMRSALLLCGVIIVIIAGVTADVVDVAVSAADASLELDLTPSLPALTAVNKVCIAVPLHEPNFKSMREFLISREKFTTGTDVAIVFSTQESLTNFSTNFAPPPSPGVHMLVYAGPPSWQAKYDKHVVLYKKMWVLYYMRDLYEYYILSDAEIKFVKSFDTYAWAQAYF